MVKFLFFNLMCPNNASYQQPLPLCSPDESRSIRLLLLIKIRMHAGKACSSAPLSQEETEAVSHAVLESTTDLYLYAGHSTPV